ncbi:hypothetical protein BofuT4_uP098550.1 [Botrytis cinerea T4]|uniref:Uncharacterized protein n=1 Tax=Botryotinia fuckeliana (strain T4) TaxID=999810 RepID=G2YCG7_BOTF4|nr:hypothetical protein BofuT4_uP098550.1 [Botrytis cinerea T4]
MQLQSRTGLSSIHSRVWAKISVTNQARVVEMGVLAFQCHHSELQDFLAGRET